MHNSHRRRSIRLQGYDYRENGAYFVTICTYEREMVFGEIFDGAMKLNEFGSIVQVAWDRLPEHFATVELDVFVVMPNHVHGVVVIATPDELKGDSVVGATHASPLHAASGPKRGSLGAIIGSFKSAVSRQINERRNTPGGVVWQRGYYDRIIRSEKELNAIREYVVYNPARWGEDENNSAH